jgi:hypothetical protein
VGVPIAASLVDVIDPALAPAATLIEDGFSALVKTLDTYKASPTATNLAQLESAAQIKNPATDTTVTKVVNLLSQAVTEIGALVPPPAAAAMGVVAPQRQAKGWKAKDFKKQFNRIVKGGARFKEL